MSIQDFSRYLIALELLQDYGGKVEDFSGNESDGLFEYLPLDSKNKVNSVKNYLIEIVGQFILLLEAGTKQYDNAVLAKKYDALREEAMIGGLALLINTYWIGNNWHYGDVMILNTLRLLIPKDLYELEEIPGEILTKLDVKLSRIVKPVLKQREHLLHFMKTLFPAHQQTMKNVVKGNHQSQAQRGNVIYRSPFGYCYVAGVSKENYRLVRPGFKWDAIQKDLIGYCTGNEYPLLPIKTLFIVES